MDKGEVWMEEKITIPLTEGEWNTIIHALWYKTTDRNNSKLAQKQYEDMYLKLMEFHYGKDSAVL